MKIQFNKIFSPAPAMTVILLGMMLFLLPLEGRPQKTAKDGQSFPVTFGLNAYSFNDLLTAKSSRDNQPLFTFFNLLDWCACQNIKAVDLTGYYFPGYPEVPSDEYIAALKGKAAKLGITITGTGIRNNFANPDPAARKADIELAKKWIVVASKLGAPVIRLFAGAIPQGYENNWDEPAGWMTECFKECAAFSEKYNVKIGIQNHGDMLQTGEQCVKIMKTVNSKWAGIILDTGSFKTEDPYKDIEMVLPYAVNWQVKESIFGVSKDVPLDADRLMKIIKKGGYKGYLPVETLVMKGRSYDPFTLVPEFTKKLEEARKEVF
ncbi:MAG TPA: sugar phosphate isomerase/epimerase family protein [Prolixibacteraceae bacterium]|nr:sugar phosphate isomerase/epimerase family protein [Prolixibacteraceae bacterium]